MKSEAVSKPANVDVLEFHNGAETISTTKRKVSKRVQDRCIEKVDGYYFVLDNVELF